MRFRRHGWLMCATLTWVVGMARAEAESAYVGAESCQKCHAAEQTVWEGTKHFASFRDVHKNPKAKDILAAVGGAQTMKKNSTCVLCHYTLTHDEGDVEPAARSGPSCESCHGAASNWIGIHNDYGGAEVTRETEPPAHKAKRIADAQARGMRWPFMKYEMASNCMSCHALTQPALDKDTLAKMLDAGHPLTPEWEFVRYAQGSVRHRFYPPDLTVNRQASPQELARAFVIGAAAKLVSAKTSLGKSDHPVYQAAKKRQADDALAVLSAVHSVPEAAALINAPTEANAKKLAAAVADKDLVGEVQGLLPDPSNYH